MKLLTMIEIISTRYRRVFRSTALVVLLLAVGVGTATWAKHDRDSLASVRTLRDATPVVHASEVSTATASTPIQNERTPITIESEHITLRRTGFEPVEITRPTGPFLLSIDNRAELGEMTFRLVRQNGSKERDLNPKKDKFRLRHVVDLPPGRYVIVEANHPDWTCRIMITPK
jgi:hypothetical protein